MGSKTVHGAKGPSYSVEKRKKPAGDGRKLKLAGILSEDNSTGPLICRTD